MLLWFSPYYHGTVTRMHYATLVLTIHTTIGLSPECIMLLWFSPYYHRTVARMHYATLVLTILPYCRQNALCYSGQNCHQNALCYSGSHHTTIELSPECIMLLWFSPYCHRTVTRMYYATLVLTILPWGCHQNELCYSSSHHTTIGLSSECIMLLWFSPYCHGAVTRMNYATPVLTILTTMGLSPECTTVVLLTIFTTIGLSPEYTTVLLTILTIIGLSPECTSVHHGTVTRMYCLGTHHTHYHRTVTRMYYCDSAYYIHYHETVTRINYTTLILIILTTMGLSPEKNTTPVLTILTTMVLSPVFTIVVLLTMLTTMALSPKSTSAILLTKFQYNGASDQKSILWCCSQ